ncbi:MAG: restriction endonuclease [Dietzia sp.]
MVQFAPDGNPTIDGCRPAVLRLLSDGKDRRLRDIITGVADVLGLASEIVEQRIKSGQGRLDNRVGWACSSMYQAGLLDRPGWGIYRITQTGRQVDARGLREYSEADMVEWEKWRNYQAEIAERQSRSSVGETVSASEEDSSSEGADPLETVVSTVNELNDVVETELRQALQQGSPEFFERAVLEVLWAMGYGGDQGEKRHLGRTNDGGIDGVIRQDPLGLQNVYVQAKRYADRNHVTSSDIRNFIGALAGRGADRGVFITTSAFTPGARETASGIHGRVILIDGIWMTSLMLRYGVGVEPREQLTVYQVNQDFFSDGLPT